MGLSIHTEIAQKIIAYLGIKEKSNELDEHDHDDQAT